MPEFKNIVTGAIVEAYEIVSDGLAAKDNTKEVVCEHGRIFVVDDKLNQHFVNKVGDYFVKGEVESKDRFVSKQDFESKHTRITPAAPPLPTRPGPRKPSTTIVDMGAIQSTATKPHLEELEETKERLSKKAAAQDVDPPKTAA